MNNMDKMQVLVVLILLYNCCYNCCRGHANALNNCRKVYENKISEGDKQLITDKHNELRTLIAQDKVPHQPCGVNFAIMKYDETLAKAAQKIANTCIFNHVTVSDGRWHAVGQNLFTSYSTTFTTMHANWTDAIQSWFDEHKDYTYGPCCASGYTGKPTGHYTQVVWANTRYVGCGYTFFKPSDSSWPYQKLYVCNYGPAGNYLGQVPYNTSILCSNMS